MAAVYPGMKPMLEFIQMPEQAEGRPRRRRHPVHTPKNPRVKTVPLLSIRPSQPVPPNIKWVSPQFNVDEARKGPSKTRRGALEIRTSKRTVQPLTFEDDDSPHISAYPSLAPHLMEKCKDMDNSSTQTERAQPSQSCGDSSVQRVDQCVPVILPELAESPERSMCSAQQSRHNSTTQSMVGRNGDLSLKDISEMNALVEEDLSSTSSMNFHLHLGKSADNMEDLSELVGHMSLEETPSKLSVGLGQTEQSTAANFSVQPVDESYTRMNSSLIEISSTEPNCAKESLSSRLEHSSHVVNQPTYTTTGPNNDAFSAQMITYGKTSFKPPSTSTPFRAKDISCDNRLPCSNTTSTETQQPTHLEFDLQVPSGHCSADDSELDSYESDLAEDASHTTCEGGSKEDSGFILAAETPQHLWLSPEVRVIDSTFS